MTEFLDILDSERKGKVVKKRGWGLYRPYTPLVLYRCTTMLLWIYATQMVFVFSKGIKAH